MKPKAAHRYRICGTPVRTGCVTCKIRRVKCDEGKPFCKRCTSTGRKCDGYMTPSQPPSIRKPPSRSSPLQSTEDPMEKRTLLFFINVTAPTLSADFSKDFWQRRVIQAANTEPSIRHAVIAIGAIHQDFISRHENYSHRQDPTIKSFGFHHYTIAISHLHKLMATETQRLDITLMCCILFICFDCISGNHDSAIIHLKAGLKILEDIKEQNIQALTRVEPNLALEWEREFAPLLLALGVQAASFVNPKYRKDRAALWRMMKDARIPTDISRFQSIDEARHALEILIADIMSDRTSTEDSSTARRPSSPHIEKAHRHSLTMSEWKVAFDRYVIDCSSRSPSTKNNNGDGDGAGMLMVHWLLISIVINMPACSEERFEQMISICESIVSHHLDRPNTSSSFGFSTDIGIIAPLFFAALRAPTLQIRRRALDLLARSPRREGMWESDDAVMVAGEALARAEESSDASEMSVSPPPQELPPFEVRTWEDFSDEHQTERFTLPLHQQIGDQPTTVLDASQFAQSMNSMELGNINFAQEYVEQPGLKSELGAAYV